MSSILKAKAALDVLALALVFNQTGPDVRFGAFAAGVLLFDVNLMLVIFVARRMFDRAGDAARSGSKKKVGAGLVLALFLKVMVLGVGAWIVLRVAGLDPLFFLAGLLAALVFFVGSATALRRHFSLSTDPKVR